MESKLAKQNLQPTLESEDFALKVTINVFEMHKVKSLQKM